VCSGVHLLGGAGLLDGRRATTFPGGEAALQRSHPDATIVTGAAIVRDGNLVTVSGELLTWQAALDVVADWAGDDVARRVADGLFLDRLVTEAAARGPQQAP
jgi:transcriptional regulator GlxA family with amidase domain